MIHDPSLRISARIFREALAHEQAANGIVQEHRNKERGDPLPSCGHCAPERSRHQDQERCERESEARLASRKRADLCVVDEKDAGRESEADGSRTSEVATSNDDKDRHRDCRRDQDCSGPSNKVRDTGEEFAVAMTRRLAFEARRHVIVVEEIGTELFPIEDRVRISGDETDRRHEQSKKEATTQKQVPERGFISR